MKYLRWLPLLMCALHGCALEHEASPDLRAPRAQLPADSPDGGSIAPSAQAARSDAGASLEPAPPSGAQGDAALGGEPDALPVPDAAGLQPATTEPGAPPQLRSLTVAMTGMDDNLERFMQFRVAAANNDFAVMGVMHEGLTEGSFEFELPRSLLAGQSYRLDFWVDHDLSGGYSRPPADHAWSVPIAAGEEDVRIDFTPHTDYVDIEKMAPTNATSLVLSSSGMGDYRHLLFDVRVTERDSGRLAGRQVRVVPGDSFDLTVGSVIRPGLPYLVDACVDTDEDGRFDASADSCFQLEGTAPASGFRLDFMPIDQS